MEATLIKNSEADVGIIGCGVAGLVAALSCSYHGQKVDIFERAGVIESAIGGGLGLNGGLLGLTKMGYHSVFKDILQPVDVWHAVHNDQEVKLEIGKEFPGTPLEGHFGIVRRQDIISELAKAVYDNPNITVRTKHKAVKLLQNKQEATVQFENESEFTYKSIICADGIHSLGKKTIFEESDFEKPDHSGFCIYYGLMSDYPETMQYPGAYEIDCDGELILMMPLKDRECLFVLLHSRATQNDPNAWSYDCTIDDLHKHMIESKIYEKQNLITEKNIRSLYRLLHLGIYQNKILPYWHKDRICLIGDAAHATSPALGQGANQAMQDGYLIGKYLSEEKLPSDAFQKLFEIRHPSTDKVIKGSQWSARLRSGNMWYSKIFRKVLRTVLRTAPGFVASKFVPNLIPQWVDDEFIAELRKVYPSSVSEQPK